MRHTLSIEILETRNECVLPIVDLSSYGKMLPVTCQKIEIMLPCSRVVRSYSNLQPGFNLALTACDISLQTKNCGEIFDSFPDGVYYVRYSVSPNDDVFVEQYHFRQSIALNRYRDFLANIENANCEPDAKINQLVEKSCYIDFLLKASKAKAEIHHDTDSANKIFKRATDLLNECCGVVRSSKCCKK